MPRPSYNWTRYWCPRDGVPQFDEQGFLADPQGYFGHACNQHLLTAEALGTKRCLVLLGEPGIGKSHEIQHFQRISAIPGEGNRQSLFFDLRAFSSDSLLDSHIFRCETFTQWLHGEGELYLFLDSLDECLLRIESIASFLKMKLGECPTNRLYVRIACRTAEWPHFLEEALQALFLSDDFGVFKLTPLCKRDVEEAANAVNAGCAEAFVRELAARNAVSLAVKPVTLAMLLGLFEEHQALPARQAELYERGCLLLCEETDEQRRRYAHQQRPEAAVLLTAASRIAAITQFANRYAIWTDVDTGVIPPEDVTVARLTGGTEQINGRRIEITEHVIRAAIETGLFTSRGPHRMGWAHQTYAEFLASRYMRSVGFGEQQIGSLLFHPDDPSQRLIPQLTETAAWIAGSNATLFNRIIRSEPDVLLRSDVASMDDEYKQRLVDKLLALFEAGDISDRDTPRYYYKLKHEGLAQQLQPFISDKTRGYLARRAAIGIAEACRVTGLLPALVSVALDESDRYWQRGEAARAVSQMGDRVARAALKPLALEHNELDREDTLKGWALEALWPEFLTAEELFQSLTPRKDSHLSGSYAYYLWQLPDLLGDSLQPEAFRFALAWVERNVGRKRDFERLTEWIMATAWRYLLDTPSLVRPYAKAAIAHLAAYESIADGTKEEPFREVIARDHERRRCLLAEVLSLPQVISYPLRIGVGTTPIVVADDFEWLSEQIARRQTDEQRAIIRLMIWLHDYSKADQLDILLRLQHGFSDLVEEFKRFEAVEIESPSGRAMKASYLKSERLRKRLESRSHGKPLLSPSPKDRVASLLEKCEQGDSNAWWILNREMTLKPDNEFDPAHDEFESDLTQLPVWAEADSTMRARLVDAAKQYVLRPPQLDWSWIGTNQYSRPCLAGYRAMVLLFQQDPSSVENLDEAVWRTWAPVAVAYIFTSGQEREEPHLSLLGVAYERAPDVVLHTLGTMIDDECARMEHAYIVRRFEHIWDDRIAEVLLEKAESLELKPTCISDLLDLLVTYSSERAIEFARAHVARAIEDGSIYDERTLAITEVIYANRLSDVWDVLWPAFQADRGFARLVFECFAKRRWREGIPTLVTNLMAQQLADLYLLFTQLYPHNQDPGWNGPIGVRHHLSEVRDGLLGELRSRGTTEACGQIRRIIASLPDLAYLKWVLQEAEKSVRMKTWTPPKPEEIMKLARDRQRRYVENGAQLLDVLWESLKRFETRLHDEIPSVETLWENRGTVTAPRWRPVDETRLSNRVAAHLREDLGSSQAIVVNREVQIRPPARRTDIHIDAIRPNDLGEGSHTIRAVIEVKGCWNRELETAMQSQLVDRYLQQNQCPNGLYLIGWFSCDRWSSDDARESTSPSYSFGEARTHFEEQATEIVGSASIAGICLKSFVLDASWPLS